MLVRKFLLGALLTMSTAAAQAPMTDQEGFYAQVLAPLERAGTPIFLAACSLDQWSYAVLFFAAGADEGSYGEFYTDGHQSNGSPVRLKPDIAAYDLMGGLATQRITGLTVDELAHQPFTLIPADEIKSRWALMPAYRCTRAQSYIDQEYGHRR